MDESLFYRKQNDSKPQAPHYVMAVLCCLAPHRKDGVIEKTEEHRERGQRCGEESEAPQPERIGEEREAIYLWVRERQKERKQTVMMGEKGDNGRAAVVLMDTTCRHQRYITEMEEQREESVRIILTLLNCQMVHAEKSSCTELVGGSGEGTKCVLNVWNAIFTWMSCR